MKKFQIGIIISSFLILLVVLTLSSQKSIKSVGIISPEVEVKDSFEQVLPKLEAKKSDIKLIKSYSFAEEARAAGDYNEASGYIVVDMPSGKVN